MDIDLTKRSEQKALAELPDFLTFSEDHDGFFVSSPNDPSTWVFLELAELKQIAAWVNRRGGMPA